MAQVNVDNCPKCDGDHSSDLLHVDGANLVDHPSYYTICPETGEIVLIDTVHVDPGDFSMDAKLWEG